MWNGSGSFWDRKRMLFSFIMSVINHDTYLKLGPASGGFTDDVQVKETPYYREGDVISLLVDMDMLLVDYYINTKHYGSQPINPSLKQLWPIASFCGPTTVEIVPFRESPIKHLLQSRGGH